MKQLILAALGVMLMIYVGYVGMERQSSFGAFFMFVGVCTAVGLALDFANAVRERNRKAALRKLGLNK